MTSYQTAVIDGRLVRLTDREVETIRNATTEDDWFAAIEAAMEGAKNRSR